MNALARKSPEKRAIPRSILLYSWVRKAPRDRIAEKPRVGFVDLPPAHHSSQRPLSRSTTAAQLSGRNRSSCPHCSHFSLRSWLPPSSGKLPSVSRHSVTRCLHKRSSRRAGASENLPRRRQNFVRQRGILDRTGERQCADNSGEGGDGATTPDGGGAPK